MEDHTVDDIAKLLVAIHSGNQTLCQLVTVAVMKPMIKHLFGTFSTNSPFHLSYVESFTFIVVTPTNQTTLGGPVLFLVSVRVALH